MKITLIILNLLMIGWLLAMTPIARGVVGFHTAAKFTELDRAGVINQTKLEDFQKQTGADFMPENRKSIGRWLASDGTYSNFLIIPAGILLLFNCLVFAGTIISRMMQKASNNAAQTTARKLADPDR